MGAFTIPSTGNLAAIPTQEFEKLFLDVIREGSGVPNEVVEEAEKKLLVLARESRREYSLMAKLTIQQQPHKRENFVRKCLTRLRQD